MEDFTFSLPTRVHFGRGAHHHVGRLVREHGSRVLIHYGSERIRNSGLLLEIKQSLWSEGLDCIEFGGVRENPALNAVQAAVKVCRNERVDFILAIGGGSVIDSAKAIALGVHNEADLWDIYSGKANLPDDALPMGVVVTNPASGSECNGVSVITNDGEGAKRALRTEASVPQFAALNPELTLTLSREQTSVAAADIFSHAFERYFDLRRSSAIRDALCEATMRTVVRVALELQKNPQDYTLRSELMWCATIAHNDMLGIGGDFGCHGIAHGLTTHHNIPHGMALGMVMPAWCRHTIARHPEAFDKFASAVWGVGTGAEGIEALEGWIRELGLPATLPQRGISAVDAAALTAWVFPTGEENLGGGLEIMRRSDVASVFSQLV